MELKRLLVIHFSQFLRSEIDNGRYSYDFMESLKVSNQCLEAAFAISDEELMSLPQFDLFTVYQSEISKDVEFYKRSLLPEDLLDNEGNSAEHYKMLGAQCMTDGDYHGAVLHYSAVARLDATNPASYCNRAAAYSKLNEHEKAIDDCTAALKLKPNYGKAFGRMGQAYSCLGQYDKAIDSYEKALAIDPVNQTCQRNITVVQSKLRESQMRDQSNGWTSTETTTNGLPVIHEEERFIDKAEAFLRDPSNVDQSESLLNCPEMQNLCMEFIRNICLESPEVAQRVSNNLLHKVNFSSQNLRTFPG